MSSHFQTDRLCPCRSIPDMVSVVLPVFNRPGFLRNAFSQILAQTHSNWELIIVDDGSTDSTPDVCRDFQYQHPTKVRVVWRENGGPGAARESGRLVARGEFLQYFDSDDEMHPEKFHRQVRLLREREKSGLVYCKTLEKKLGGEPCPTPAQMTGEEHTQLFPRVLSGCLWPTTTPLYRKEVTDRLGPWLPLRQEEDWEYDARLAAAGVPLAYTPEPLACTVHHNGPRAAGGPPDPVRLRDRCRARILILGHARSAGVCLRDPNMVQFVGGMFLLARQCALAGLEREARQLLAASSTVATGGRAAKVLVFRLLVFVLGSRVISLVSEKLHRP